MTVQRQRRAKGVKKQGETPAQATVEATVKSRRKSQLHGVAVDPSLRGKGPKKGAPNAGRPPDKFKEMCRALASSAEVEKEVHAILKEGSDNAMFLGALKWASEHGYGRPDQSVDLKSGGLSLAELLTMGEKKADA